jgi:hypothetical protein
VATPSALAATATTAWSNSCSRSTDALDHLTLRTRTVQPNVSSVCLIGDPDPDDGLQAQATRLVTSGQVGNQDRRIRGVPSSLFLRPEHRRTQLREAGRGP